MLISTVVKTTGVNLTPRLRQCGAQKRCGTAHVKKVLLARRKPCTRKRVSSRTSEGKPKRTNLRICLRTVRVPQAKQTGDSIASGRNSEVCAVAADPSNFARALTPLVVSAMSSDPLLNSMRMDSACLYISSPLKYLVNRSAGLTKPTPL